MTAHHDLERPARNPLERVAVDIRDQVAESIDSKHLTAYHVLKAMGLPTHRTQNSLRFSLGMYSTDAEVDFVVSILPRLVEKLRSLTRRTVNA